MSTSCKMLEGLIKATPDGVAKQYLERAYELMGCGGVHTQDDSGGGPTTPPPTPNPPPGPPHPGPNDP